MCGANSINTPMRWRIARSTRRPHAAAPRRRRSAMFLWYCAGAVFLTWNVFQTTGLDLRAVGGGALLPLVVDLVAGHQAFGHSLLAPVSALGLVMIATVGWNRRLVRRRAIGVPIGWFCGLGLSGAFTAQRTFWWPAFGTRFDGLALIPPLGYAVAFEVLGLGAACWCWVRFGLADPQRRRALVVEGRASVVT